MSPQSWALRLRNARTTAEQVAVLKAIKNGLIGHPLKKELAVTTGVLDPIARLLSNRSVDRGDGKPHDHRFASRPLNEEEIARLQGLYVVASIAMGGPAFLPRLQSSAILPAILSNLCPSSNPSQIVLAALRALSNLADSCLLASNSAPLSTNTLADALFSRQNVYNICRILSQTSLGISVQSQINIVASLISRICREERHQQSLASHGVLDVLATKLASFAVAQGLVIPGAEVLAVREELHEFFPLAAPPGAELSLILEAISVIIADSKLRASQLLFSPSILAVFPSVTGTEFIVNQKTRTAWNSSSTAGIGTQQAPMNAVDFLLPCIPIHPSRSLGSQSSAFPPLGSSASKENAMSSSRKFNGTSLPNWTDSLKITGATGTSSVDVEDPESPLIAYLIFLLRSKSCQPQDCIERLMAASVLTVLYRAGLTNKTRETAIGLLVVPLLVQMLEDMNSFSSKDQAADIELTKLDQAVKERAPAVLAMLITDSEYLQKTAFDAGIIGKLSKMLKVSYDPVVGRSDLEAWSPQGMETVEEMDGSQHADRDSVSQAPLLIHRIRVRESTLKAIAALIPFKDDYRKAIVDQGMIPYIVESMNPCPGKPMPKGGDKSEKVESRQIKGSDQGYGKNPVTVLIAACGAIRALSRSVSILRTTLIDNGVAMPVFNLLKHHNIEVQIAATATMCNLVTDISPMRELITRAGILKILCEHAHSHSVKLRLNALWALKHFVHAVNNDMKRNCLEELGQGWLIQLICDDTEDETSINQGSNEVMLSMTTSSDGTDEDVEMDQFEDQLESSLGETFGLRAVKSGKTVQQAEARLAVLRDAETNPAKRARKDDIAVQEQGLDFIRNLIGGAEQGGSSETTEMIDFLFGELGQDRFFEILASKLRSKVVNPFNRRGTGMATTVIPPQSEIIIAVGYILVHMAASVPRHRQLVIAQTELLKLLVPQFNHPNIEVRLALCWLITNLTWMDDASDGQACAQRANELRKLGFLSKLELLETDPELNVRERAKSAVWQMKQGL